LSKILTSDISFLLLVIYEWMSGPLPLPAA
jgi:hypothetical protein